MSKDTSPAAAPRMQPLPETEWTDEQRRMAEPMSRLLDEPRILDAIFTVGQYNMLAMALKTLHVEREPGVPGFDG